jgi:c-di-GMP-binding flagellar brake protein YcgR
MVELEFGEPPSRVNAPVLNLSRGGLFFSLERGFPALHSVIEFRLTLAKIECQPTIQGRALVRWVRERPGSGHLPGVGLEFTEMSEAARAFVDSYVDRTSVRQRAPL